MRTPWVLTAAYLVLLRGDEVLLLRRCNTGYEDGKHSLVSGHVEPGEQVSAAMLREAAEEAGISIAPEHLRFEHVMQRRCEDGLHYVDFFFSARVWDGEVRNLEPAKCDDLSWFRLSELPATVIPYVRSALTAIAERVPYSENGW